MLEVMGSADEVDQATREYRELQAAEREAKTAFESAKRMTVKVCRESNSLPKHANTYVSLVSEISVTHEKITQISHANLKHSSKASIIKSHTSALTRMREKLRELL